MTELVPHTSVGLGDMIDCGDGYWLVVRQIPPASPAVQDHVVHIVAPFAGIWAAPAHVAGKPGIHHVEDEHSIVVIRQN